MDPIIYHEVVPLPEEEVRVEKWRVETGRVTIRLETEVEAREVSDVLASETFDIKRIAVGRLVDTPPEVRRVGEATVYPVVEEVFVKRLNLREEIWVTPVRAATPFNETVTLRRTRAVVQRQGPAPSSERLAQPTDPQPDADAGVPAKETRDV